MRSGIVVLLICCADLHDIGALEPYLELNQILAVAVGAEVRLAEATGVRGSVGVSPLGITVVTCSLTTVRHLRRSDAPFQVDLEAGMPLAYFDMVEGRFVDWNRYTDSPYAGWTFGGGVVWGYRRAGRQYSLVTGYSAWWEWQEDDGWKGPRGIAIVSLRYAWHVGDRRASENAR